MSWNINTIGKPSDLKAYLDGISYFPQPLKDTVGLFADAGTKEGSYSPPPGLLHLKTSGHYDEKSGGSNVTEFSLNPVQLIQPAPPPV